MGETPSGDDGRDERDGDDGSDRRPRRNRWSRLPSGRGPTPATDDADGDDRPPLPLDGDVLLYTGATASVGPERVEPLLREVAAYLRAHADDYRRRYESAVADDDRRVLLVPEGHWETVGAELDLRDREVDAVRRAHAQQLRRLGSRTDRRDEFETALEIREAVVIER